MSSQHFEFVSFRFILGENPKKRGDLPDNLSGMVAAFNCFYFDYLRNIGDLITNYFPYFIKLFLFTYPLIRAIPIRCTGACKAHRDPSRPL